MGGERGQGTVEWVGLVALIAGALLAGSVLAQAPFAAGAVSRQFARALCIARLGDCNRTLEPCVVRASSKDSGFSVSVIAIELGGGEIATIERRSDGTYLVSSGTRTSGGLFGSVGIGAKAEAGGKLGLDLSGGVSVSRSISDGRGWIVRSRAEADRLLADLAAATPTSGGRTRPVVRGRRRTRALPEPDIVYREQKNDLDGNVSLTIAKAKATGGVAGVGRSVERTDRRTGERTVSFIPDTLDVTGKLPLLGSGSRRIHGGEEYRLVFDAAGRPVDLQIQAISDELPEIARPFGGMLQGTGKERPDRYETTAHLDLTDAVNRAAAAVLLRRNGNAGRVTEQDERDLDRLRERVERTGTVEVRGLRTESGGRPYAMSVSTGIGRLGARALKTTASSRLITAASRGLDGSWHPRDDCVARTFAAG